MNTNTADMAMTLATDVSECATLSVAEIDVVSSKVISFVSVDVMFGKLVDWVFSVATVRGPILHDRFIWEAIISALHTYVFPLSDNVT